MSNTQAAFGFKWMGDVTSHVPSFVRSVRAIDPTNATAIGYGDPVVRVAANSPYIQQASAAMVTAAEPLEGIFVGCRYVPSGYGGVVESDEWPGAASQSDVLAFIIDDPFATFLVATLSTAIASSQIGMNVSFTGSSPVFRRSTAVIDASTVSSSAALPFRILGQYGPYWNNPGNDAPGAFGGVGNGADQTTNYAWAVVTFNNQINRVLTGF